MINLQGVEGNLGWIYILVSCESKNAGLDERMASLAPVRIVNPLGNFP